LDRGLDFFKPNMNAHILAQLFHRTILKEEQIGTLFNPKSPIVPSKDKMDFG